MSVRGSAAKVALFIFAYHYFLARDLRANDTCPNPQFKIADGQYVLSYGSSISIDRARDINTLEYCIQSLDKHAVAFNWAGPRFAGWAFPGVPGSQQLPTLSSDLSTQDSLLYYGASQKSSTAPFIPVQSKPDKPEKDQKKSADSLVNRIKIAVGSQSETRTNFVLIDAELTSYTFPLANGKNEYIYEWRNLGPMIRHQSANGKELPEEILESFPIRLKSDAFWSAERSTLARQPYSIRLTPVNQAVSMQSADAPRRELTEVDFLGGDLETVGSASVVIYVPDSRNHP